MSTTRRGKIARLCWKIRTELNRRLDDGEPAHTLLAWLNEQPGVKAVLAAQFGGRPITEQNLSEWRQGGFQDWLRWQANADLVEQMAEAADDMDGALNDAPVSECLAPIIAAELARTARDLLAEDVEPMERWRRLREIHAVLTRQRRLDQAAARAFREREDWGREQEQARAEEGKRRIQTIKDEALAPLRRRRLLRVMTEAYGGTEEAREIAALEIEVQHGLPRGTLTGKAPMVGAAPAPTQPGRMAAEKT